MSGSLAIDAKGIQKTYGTGDAAVTALRGVDLSASFGEMVALVGPSGCGKTTFISILAGLLSRDGGSMLLAGVDPDGLNNHQRTLWRRSNVGFIFQQFNLVPQISVLENVAIPLLLRGDSRKDSLERAAMLLERVGLKGREEARPTDGGRQTRRERAAADGRGRRGARRAERGLALLLVARPALRAGGVRGRSLNQMKQPRD
jgi:putative ABC transport system ATP-binding protein